MSGKRPWMPLYIDDFLAGTAHLSATEVGGYMLLIMHYWSKGSLPADENLIMKISRLSKSEWKKARNTLHNFFTIEWRHERIDAELAKAIEKSRINSANAVLSHSNRKPKARANASANATANAYTLQTPHIEGGGGDARAREADPEALDSNPLVIDSPLGGAIPIDRWDPPPIDPSLTDLFQAFAVHHMDEGTFSSDWPALWASHIAANAANAAKRAKAAPKARVEVNKRPEQPAGRRVLISPEAFALAKEIEDILGVAGQPITVGMPSQMETWLASWAPDTIVLSVREVMAKRAAAGDTTLPGSMKYFEKAIARAHAEIGRQLPVYDLTTAPPQDLTHAHARRQTTKSVPDAAKRLTAKLAALSGGGTAAGVGEGGAVGGTVQEIGGGRSGHVHRVVDAGDAGLPADGAGSRLPPGEGTGDQAALDAHSEGGA